MGILGSVRLERAWLKEARDPKGQALKDGHNPIFQPHSQGFPSLGPTGVAQGSKFFCQSLPPLCQVEAVLRTLAA